mmetsp:Transcript_1182/g.3299  ORF Transcript_1182/g.3299 Transcript_1182/m.3299 type:complete len:340 (+) Transcript_1182:403-1422(+)
MVDIRHQNQTTPLIPETPRNLIGGNISTLSSSSGRTITIIITTTANNSKRNIQDQAPANIIPPPLPRTHQEGSVAAARSVASLGVLLRLDINSSSNNNNNGDPRVMERMMARRRLVTKVINGSSSNNKRNLRREGLPKVRKRQVVVVQTQDPSRHPFLCLVSPKKPSLVRIASSSLRFVINTPINAKCRNTRSSDEPTLPTRTNSAGQPTARNKTSHNTDGRNRSARLRRRRPTNVTLALPKMACPVRFASRKVATVTSITSKILCLQGRRPRPRMRLRKDQLRINIHHRREKDRKSMASAKTENRASDALRNVDSAINTSGNKPIQGESNTTVNETRH